MKIIQKITKNWPIHKILEIYPDSVELMLEIGLHCFSCSANTEERLNQGMKLHGFTDQDIDSLVEKINAGLADYQEKQMRKPTKDDMQAIELVETNTKYYKVAGLLFTQTAFDALHDLLEDFSGLQIKLDAGGCSGYSYIYDFKNQPEPDEQIYNLSDKLQLYINDFTFDKLYGTIVDFNYGIKDAGLKFKNPNTKDACHCGTSVGF